MKTSTGDMMNNSRRNFFKKLSILSLSIGAPIGLNSPGGTTNFLSNGLLSNFPITVITKYYFPEDKTPVDVRHDMEKWGQSSKFSEVYKKLVAEGKVSTKMDSSFKSNHLESAMYFKNLESYQEYVRLLSTHKVVNTNLQKQLGYKVIVEVV